MIANAVFVLSSLLVTPQIPRKPSLVLPKADNAQR